MKAPDLGKMIGPLPLGGWLAAGGAGLGIAWYLKRRGGMTPAASEAVGAAQVAQLDASQLGGAVPLAGGGSSSDSSSGSSGTPAPQSNDEWGRQAVNMLLAKAYNPLIATSAVADYLNGEQLDVAETAALTLVLGLIGAPPQGTPPLKSTPAPTTPVTSAPLSPQAPVGLNGKLVSRLTIARHDGRGGYAFDQYGGIHPYAGRAGDALPPMPVWNAGKTPVFHNPIRAGIITPNDAAGWITTSQGETAGFTIPKVAA